MRHIATYQRHRAIELLAEQAQELNPGYVTGKDGKPLTVYHGTTRRFSRFDTSYMGRTDEGFYGRGFYFTPDMNEAKDFGQVIVRANIIAKNPFYLRTWTSVGSAAEIDLREDLSKLRGIPADIRPVRTLPGGYYVREDDTTVSLGGDRCTTYAVWPKEELYGTEKEIYGPDVVIAKRWDEGRGREQAIVEFNDMVNGTDRYNTGQANWLLQQVGRDGFHEVLSNNGYDAIFVYPAGEKRSVENVDEIVVWDPDQIKILENEAPAKA